MKLEKATEAVKEQRERGTAVHEIHSAMILNQSVDELARIVEPLRGQGEPAAKSLVSYSDSLDGEARTTMFRLLQKYPDNHPVVISLLRRVLELLEQDRRSPDLSPAQKCDLDWLERYARHIARFILRKHLATLN